MTKICKPLYRQDISFSLEICHQRESSQYDFSGYLYGEKPK